MLASAAVLLLAAAARAEPANLILRRGKIFLSPGRYAESLAIEGNRISAVGADADVMTERGPKTRVIELKGRAVVPGFHDTLNWLFRGSLRTSQFRAEGAKSLDALQQRLAGYAAEHPDDSWIVGRGWTGRALAGEREPTSADLDLAVSTRPVIIQSGDETRAWLNTLAMEQAGITARTPVLNNGEIVKDPSGQPTGVLGGAAVGLATRAVPAPTKRQKLEALRQIFAKAQAAGITSIDSLAGKKEPALAERVALARELIESGAATPRLFFYGDLDDPSGALAQRKATRGLPRIKLGVPGVGAELDGALDERTAALLQPYFDSTQQKGTPLYLWMHLDLAVRAAHKAGLQVALAASGDRAVRMALDACEKSQRRARGEDRILPEIPCRVENAAVVAPEDLPRFKALSAAVIERPGMFLFDDQLSNYLPNRLGDRARWSFALKSFEDAGAFLALATGWPDGGLDPRPGLFEAATRQNLDGTPAQGWFPQERVSLEDAVEAFTERPATLVGLDDELGSIRPGKLADLAVFADDIFARAPRALLDTPVALTIIDGKIVYDIDATHKR